VSALLRDRLEADLKAALKSGDALRVSVLRLARSAATYKEIQAGRALTFPKKNRMNWP
jgi:uncharacterized protein YqeY